MIEDIDRQIVEWIGTVLTDVEISLMPPGDMGDKTLIGLYLKDILPSSPVHTHRRPPLQVSLRYLITSWDKDPVKAHRMLYQLLFAALEHDEYDVELKPLAAQVWRAFGLPPRPSFMLRLPLRFDRPDQTTHVVRSPVEVRKKNIVNP